MNSVKACFVENSVAMPLSSVPCISFDEFQRQVDSLISHGSRVCSFFGMRPHKGSGQNEPSLQLIVVLANDVKKHMMAFSTQVEKSFPSFTPRHPQFHMFEREIAEQWEVTPMWHPGLFPARFHPSFAGNGDWSELTGVNHEPGVANFFNVEGGEAHEVAVGPVHAGIIEPGHFRFQCHGEKVFHLEISLGYQHRGIEKILCGGPHKRTSYQMEVLAGDTTIGHYTAYCQAVEALQGIQVSPETNVLRALGLELERLANHTGDLGAMAGDVGYLPTASYCGRIRGDFLNMTALICGNRLGRGFIRPGAPGFSIDSPERLEKLVQALSRAEKDAESAISLLWTSPTVMSRFENTGRISKADCIALGLVGPVARACGMTADVRHDFPFGRYLTLMIPDKSSGETMTGDVASRALVRWEEIQTSFRIMQKLLAKITFTAASKNEKPLAYSVCQPDSIVVSLVEGWRGEICHTAVTDSQGRFARYKIVDPSFHNWIGLGLAMRNQEISDFPLCNKSFNLSYCGFDL